MSIVLPIRQRKDDIALRQLRHIGTYFLYISPAHYITLQHKQQFFAQMVKHANFKYFIRHIIFFFAFPRPSIAFHSASEISDTSCRAISE
jgi:hypothetical protein